MKNYNELKRIMDEKTYLFQGLTPEREIKFKKWLPENMEIYNKFIELARVLRKVKKLKSYSARAIWERIRWDTMLSDTDPLYKISDLNMPFVSWLSMEAEEDLAGMFKKRVMKRQVDFPELEGKGIEYYYSSHGESKAGRVIGCNFDIGVTILEETSDLKLVCLNGPSHEDFNRSIEDYTRQFYMIVEMIKMGKYTTRVIFSAESGGTVTSNCSFSGY